MARRGTQTREAQTPFAPSGVSFSLGTFSHSTSLYCVSVAAFLAATLTGFTPNTCDAQSRAIRGPNGEAISPKGAQTQCVHTK